MTTETKHHRGPPFAMSMFPDELSLYKAKAEHYEAQFEKAARIGYEQDKELKALKGRWHNLKKDPNDLPDDGETVEVFGRSTGDGDGAWAHAFFNSEIGKWLDPEECASIGFRPTHWRHLDTPEEAQ